MSEPSKLNYLREGDLAIPDGPVDGHALRQAFGRLFSQLNPWALQVDKLSAKGLTFSDNVRCEIVRAKFTHGVATRVSLKTLARANGAVILGWDSQLPAGPPMVQMVQLQGQSLCDLTIWFNSTAAAAVPCTVLVLDEGQQSAATPSYLSGGAGGGLPTLTNEGYHLQINSAAAAWNNIGGIYQPDVSTNRCLRQALVLVAATGVTSLGAAAQTVTTPGAAAAYLNRNSQPMIVMTTNATTGSIAGYTYAANDGYLNTPTGFWIGGRFTTGTSIAASRIWVGCADAAIGSQVPPTTAAALARHMIAFAYDSAVNSGKWLLVTADGTNASGVDTGLAAAANTDYWFLLHVNGFPVTTVTGYIWEQALNVFTVPSNKTLQTANLPGGTAVGAQTFIETRENVSKTFRFCRYAIGY